MTKNNRKKAVAQAISTAVALGWVIMQVESAQAATLVVNNLNDSGVGSLRDTINIATSNDVVEFLLESHPSTISLTSGALAIAKNLTINGPGANLLTISGNNHFPVFDINAADVTFSGLAIAGNIKAYDSSNLTFINSTINGDNLKIDNPTGKLTLINSTINGNNSVNINTNTLTLTDGSQVRDLSNTNAGDLTISAATLRISNGANVNSGQISNGSGGNISINSDLQIIGRPEPSPIAAGSNNSGAAGTLTIKTSSLLLRDGATVNRNSGSISDGLGGNISINAPNGFIVAPPNEASANAASNNNSGAGGNITLIASSIRLRSGTLISKPVPEPSAIAGSILAVSLAWLAKRKQDFARQRYNYISK